MNKQDNYLDFIPKKNPEFSWEMDEQGNVTLQVEHKGFFYALTQKLFKRPRFTQVHLDKMGNFVWPLIDGKRSVGDIALEVKKEFGEAAEPLYERLVQYMRTLESYMFIQWK